MQTTNCCGIFGLLFGHKYKARYDTHEVPHYPPGSEEIAKRPDLREIIIAAKDDISEDCEIVNAVDCVVRVNAETETLSTYKGDVCVRCGNVINKPN